MTVRNVLSLGFCLALSVAACDSKKEDAKPGDAKSADAKGGDAKGGEAKAAGGADYTKVDDLVKNAKTSEDFDKVLEACMSLAIDLAMSKKIENADSDPDYWTHCKIGPARAKAQVVIKESTPDKMSTMCISAAMTAEEIRDSGKPEAGEFKTLAENVNKACGM